MPCCNIVYLYCYWFSKFLGTPSSLNLTMMHSNNEYTYYSSRNSAVQYYALLVVLKGGWYACYVLLSYYCLCIEYFCAQVLLTCFTKITRRATTPLKNLRMLLNSYRQLLPMQRKAKHWICWSKSCLCSCRVWQTTWHVKNTTFHQLSRDTFH